MKKADGTSLNPRRFACQPRQVSSERSQVAEGTDVAPTTSDREVTAEGRRSNNPIAKAFTAEMQRLLTPWLRKGGRKVAFVRYGLVILHRHILTLLSDGFEVNDQFLARPRGRSLRSL